MFNMPSIPTDSLYKFLFVGGLVLIIAAFVFSDRQYNAIEKDKVHITLDSVNFELNEIWNNHVQKNKFLATAKKELEDTLAAYDGNSLPKLFDLYEQTFQTDTAFASKYKFLKIYYLNPDLRESMNKQDHKIKNLIENLTAYEANIVDYETLSLRNKQTWATDKDKELHESLNIFNYYIKVSGITGGLFALIGIIFWYLKLQRLQDQLLVLQVQQLRETLDAQKGQSDTKKAAVDDQLPPEKK